MPIQLPPLSRRQFLIRSLLAGTGLTLGARCFGRNRVADPHVWALLSDPHIHQDRAKMARGIVMSERLTTAVNEVLGESLRPAGVLVNGDLAFNTGETADYGTFAALIDPLRTGSMPVHLALGNHDHRERFWAAMTAERGLRGTMDSRHVSIVRSPRANWFILDSLDRTMSTPGALGELQLAWLARELDAHADRPAIVLVHHNPTIGSLKNSLLDHDAFFAVIRPRRHVKAYVFGHTHRWVVGQDESGIHLINLPTTAYVFDPAAATGWVSAQLEQEGIRLKLHCLERTHAEHGRQVELTWRS